jgi:hypothetical protein
MQRNLSGILAVVFAIALSSFTVKKFVNVYMVFDIFESVEKDVNNYTQQAGSPGTFANSSPKKLAWFRILDVNDGVIDFTEFDTGFETLDITSTSNNRLSDEPLSSEGPALEFR